MISALSLFEFITVLYFEGLNFKVEGESVTASQVAEANP